MIGLQQGINTPSFPFQRAAVGHAPGCRFRVLLASDLCCNADRYLCQEILLALRNGNSPIELGKLVTARADILSAIEALEG